MHDIGAQLETPETLAWLRERAASGSLSRRALAREACERLQWRDEKGRLREMSCRKRLLLLQRRGLVELPAARGARPEPHKAKPPETASVEGSLAELGKVELICVTGGDSQLSALWNGLMQTHHPLAHV